MKILVVDDSSTMRRIIVRTLEGIGESDVTEASDGEDALHKVNSTGFELILTDWNMPNLDGLGLVEKLRANAKYKTTPIIMITTEAEKKNVVEAIKAGVNNYIVKPFTPATLKEKIQATLDQCSK
ncbi:MAG: response regulator [Candidatus Coatesbacteria bacterium]|nr:response regulator [Candidatus Coatesbacteria bacterium]